MSFIPFVYTVENVTKGHPDRVCDRIADAILHAYEAADPYSRVAIEVFGTNGLLLIGGEVSSSASVDVWEIAYTILQEIGYEKQVKIEVRIHGQSTQIAGAVDRGGAGDQGIMYGYACDETSEFLPLGVALSRRLVARLEDVREFGEISWLRPDGKVQVTIRDRFVDTVLMSVQHDESVLLEELQETIKEKIIDPVIPSKCRRIEESRILVNPAGLWTVGGFVADTGLTGRKLACDSYGGILPNGGGSTHGKDLTKVDCSATLAARKAAVEIVKSGKARECLVSVAYAIGMEKPLMLEAVNERRESIVHLIDPSGFSVKNLLDHKKKFPEIIMS